MKTNQLYSVIGKVECYILQVINHVVYCMYQEQAKDAQRLDGYMM